MHGLGEMRVIPPCQGDRQVSERGDKSVSDEIWAPRSIAIGGVCGHQNDDESYEIGRCRECLCGERGVPHTILY